MTYDSLQVLSSKKQLAPSLERVYLIQMLSVNQRAYYVVADGFVGCATR
jgi:hypothetical protein